MNRREFLKSLLERRSPLSHHARPLGGDLGRRNLGILAVRSAAAAGRASSAVQSAPQCLVKGGQQERGGLNIAFHILPPPCPWASVPCAI